MDEDAMGVDQVEPGQVGSEPAGDLPTVLVVAVLVLAVALRLPALNAGLWLDEIETLVAFTRLPVWEIPFALESQNNHVLFSLSAWATTTVFGESAWSLRLPAVLFGVASVWAAYGLGAELGSRREGLLMALLMAVSSHHVFFSQSARGYTALLFTATLATTLFIRLLKQGDRAGRAVRWGYPLVLLATCMAHLTGGAVVAVHGAVGLFVWMRGRPEGRAVVLGAATAAALIALWLLPGLRALMLAFGGSETGAVEGGGSEWTTFGWMVRTTLEGLASGVPGGWPALLVAALVGTVGLLSVARKTPAATVAMLLPPVLILVGLVATNHNLWPRFFFFAMAFAALFAVRGLTESATAILGRRGVAVAGGVLVLAALGSVWTVPGVWVPKQDYEGVTAWLEDADLDGEQIAYLSWAHYGFMEYLGAPGHRVETLEELLALEDRTDHLVLVYTLPEDLRSTQPGLWAHVQEHYRETRVFPAGVTGAELVVMESAVAERGSGGAED